MGYYLYKVQYINIQYCNFVPGIIPLVRLEIRWLFVKVTSRWYLVISIAEHAFMCLKREVLLVKDESFQRFGVLELSFMVTWPRWHPLFRPAAGLLSKMALYFIYSSFRNAANIDPRLMRGVLLRLLIAPPS